MATTKSARLAAKGDPLARGSRTPEGRRKQQRNRKESTSRELVGNPPYSARLSTMRACPVQRPCAPLRSRRLTYYIELSTGRVSPPFGGPIPQGEARGQRRGEEGGGEERRREAAHAWRGGRSARGAPGRAFGELGAGPRCVQGRSSARGSWRRGGSRAVRSRFQGGPWPEIGRQTHPGEGLWPVPAIAPARAPPPGPAAVVITVPWQPAKAL